jgi:hypothetical protein
MSDMINLLYKEWSHILINYKVFQKDSDNQLINETVTETNVDLIMKVLELENIIPKDEVSQVILSTDDK